MAQAFRVKNLETLQACPLCIICAKPRDAITLAREFNLETKISSDLVDGIPDGQRLDFHIGSFTLDNSSIPYYVTSPSRQGIQTFGIEAATLFSILKPRYALHVGVCAAISGKDIQIGDVIFGERALNYEEGKYALQDGESAFKPDVKVVEVRGPAMDGFIAQADQPMYKYGDFVSGSAVRMDASSIFDRVQNTTLRNVAALDMEASAFLQAGDFTGVQCIGVIKGVSEMGDSKKQQANNKYYMTALCRAARAAKSYVRYKLDKVPKAVLDYSREPGVVITHGYFDDTIARVMDKLEYAEYKVSAGNEIEGLRIVLPGKLLQENPKEEDVESFNVDSFSASDGALASLIRNYGLQEITLNGPPRQTNIHLKGSYLVDLPTTLAATLSKMQGKDKQVNLFRQSMTNKVKRYKGFVQVITWDEFQKLGEQASSTGSARGQASRLPDNILPYSSPSTSESEFITAGHDNREKGDKYRITEEDVKSAAENERSGERVMGFLVEKRGEEMVKAATINGLEAVVKMLLAEDGIDPDAKDKDGRTLLSCAAEEGHVAVVQLLLEHGADMNSMDQNGMTPFSWAWQNRHESVTQLMLESDSAHGQDISALPPYTGEHAQDLTAQDIADKLTADNRNYSALLGDFIECIYRGIFDLSLAQAKHPAVPEIEAELNRLKVEVDAMFTTEDRLYKLATRIPTIAKLIDSISNTFCVVTSTGAEIFSTKAIDSARRGLHKLTTGLEIVRQTLDVCFFPDWNGFRSILDSPPGSFLIATASSQNVFANTMACYVSWRWGKRGRDTLSWLAELLLNSTLPKPRTTRPLRIRPGVGDAEPVCVELQGLMTGKLTAGLSNGNIAIRTRWIGGTLEDYYVQVADIASQLAWIVAALKKPSDTEVSLTRARIEYFQDKESHLEPEDFCLCFRVEHEVAPSQLLGDGEDTCWHELFTGLNVAVGFPVPKRPDRMRGVELPLSLMTTLANVSYPIAYKAGFVLKGWRNALFPVRIDSGSCLSEAASTLQWHLYSSGKERLYMAEAKAIKPDLLPIKAEFSQRKFITVIEQMKRHFLGLYENATVRIGTDDSRSDNIEPVYIDNRLKESRLQGRLCWSRIITGSVGGGYGGASFGVSTGVRIRTKKEQQRLLDVERTVDKLIERTLINSTILYDTQTKVAWMLPQICVVLYLIQVYAKQYAPAHENIHYPTFDTYEKNIGDLKDILVPFWRDEAAQKAHFDLEKTFIYFTQVLDQLQDDKDLKPAKGLNSRRLAGVDFARLADQPQSYSIITVDVNDKTGGDWLRMLRSDWEDTKTPNAPYRVVTLFCNNLHQPPFLPLLPPPVVCNTWSRPPQGCDYLVVHQHCLRKLTAIYGSDPVQVSSEHCCVRGEQLPFQHCSNQQICNPLQRIVKDCQRYQKMTEWIGEEPPDAVFIFGHALGTKFQRHCTHAL